MPGLDIDNIFTYHPPTQDQIDRYEVIRDVAREFAGTIVRNTPASAEQTRAIRKLQEAVMFANAAIAINEVKESE